MRTIEQENLQHKIKSRQHSEIEHLQTQITEQDKILQQHIEQQNENTIIPGSFEVPQSDEPQSSNIPPLAHNTPQSEDQQPEDTSSSLLAL